MVGGLGYVGHSPQSTVTVRAWDGTCIYRHNNSSCTPSIGTPNATVHLPSGWTGFPDYADDIAVVVADAAWPAPYNSSAAWNRMAGTKAWTGLDVWLYGYGVTCHTCTDNGVSRVSSTTIDVDWSGSTHFSQTVQQNETRACIGDSGGIALYPRSTGWVNILFLLRTCVIVASHAAS
jgi:hypothetical protein